MAQKNTKFNQATTSKPATSKNLSFLNIIKSREESTIKTILSVGTQQKILENYIIVWLDENLDFSNEDSQEFISQLRCIVNTIQTSTNTDECLQYLTHVYDEKVFLIISDVFSDQIASLEDQFTQLVSVYVFCDAKTRHHTSIKTYKKGKGIFTNIQHLCNELRKDVRDLEKNLISSSVISNSSKLNPNQVDPSFMYCQLLKENFFTINDEQNAVDDLIEYCQSNYERSMEEAEDIEEFRSEYDCKSEKKSPIWWYTREGFLYHMLNRALRVLDIEALMKMSFFIRDLHEQIQERHSKPLDESLSVLFRGQRLSNTDFEKLKANRDGLQSFNNFLSTSKKEEKAVGFTIRSIRPNTVGILWVIKIDPSISSVPFTWIEDITAVKEEDEVLFSIGAVFRIGNMEKTGHYWRVNLTLTDHRDPLLNRLTDHIRRSLGHGKGWRPLGQLMIKMGHFSKAKEIYEKLKVNIRPDDNKEDYVFLCKQLGYIEKQMGRLKEAFDYYQKALDLSKEYMSSNDSRLSSIYSNIGAILKKLNDFDQALKYFEFALKIDLAASEPNQLEIAIDYNNIGAVLDHQGKYTEALKNYGKALEIKLVHLPSTHPSLANNYSNIGVIHRKMGDCSMALSYYEKTLSIQEKSLPPNHPSLIVTHGNMASALESLGEFDKAVKHAEKAVKIAEITCGSEHPEYKKRCDFLTELRQRHQS